MSSTDPLGTDPLGVVHEFSLDATDLSRSAINSIRAVLGVSESRVCQIHGQLKKTLREVLDDDAPLFRSVS